MLPLLSLEPLSQVKKKRSTDLNKDGFGPDDIDVFYSIK